ncbi:GTPase-activating protein [Actinomortierella wolfii]|nr:GTPase-activating protein [Actinomortierella wolfii]
MMANSPGRRASTYSTPDDDDKDFYDPIDTYGSDHDSDVPITNADAAAAKHVPTTTTAAHHHPSHPSSPVATRSQQQQGFYDFDERPTTTTTATAPTATSSVPQQTEGISRRSWEEYDSEEEDQYPVDAYDYGPEEDDYESDEYEERPSSRRISSQQHTTTTTTTTTTAAAAATPTGAPALATLSEQQGQQQQQSPVLSPVLTKGQVQQQQQQGHDGGAPHLSQEQPPSPSPAQAQQSYFQAPSSPSSPAQQDTATLHHSLSSIHKEEQYPNKPSPRSSISSDDAGVAAPPSAPPVAAAAAAAAAASPTHHAEQSEPQQSKETKETSSFRHSYYEEDSSEDEQDPYQYGVYDDQYDSHTNDERDDREDDKPGARDKYSDDDASDSDREQNHRPAAYSDGYKAGRESARNSYQLNNTTTTTTTTTSGVDQRASVSSQRSYSSHSKHHSFGYGDRAALAPSDSESESESESDNEVQKASVAAIGAAAAVAAVGAGVAAAAASSSKRSQSPSSPRVAAAAAAAATAPPPPVPSRSRPTSYTSATSPLSPTMNRAASPTMTRAVSPAMNRPASPTMTRARSPTITRAASPTMTRATSPVMTRAASPTMTRAASPTMTRAASPTMTRAASPTMTRAASPTMTRAASPTMTRAAATPVAVPASPTTTRSMASPTPYSETDRENGHPRSPVETRSLQSPRSPISPRTANHPFPSPISTINGGMEKTKNVAASHSSSDSSVDQHSRLTRHSSDSDTSGTSIDLQSPSNHHGGPGLNGFGILKSPTFQRSMSSNSTSMGHHGLVNGHGDHHQMNGINHKGASIEKQRPISYATVFSDAELNDISLDEPTSASESNNNNNKRSSGAPKTPSTPSAFGFPSSFFGSRPHPMSQTAHHAPHPPASSTATNADTGAATAAAAAAALPPPPSATAVPIARAAGQPITTSPPLPPVPSPAPAADPRSNVSRSASISAVGSTISAAFGRLGSFAAGNSLLGGGSNSNNNNNNNNGANGTPPPLPRTASSGSTTPGPINTGIDLRRTSNVSPERASTLSTMTNDSNMDLLLARLEAQNEMLEQDTKRRLAIEQEKRQQMEKALGHAKEESSGEAIDWDYWGALMNDYNGVVKRNPKQLTKMIQAGVPPALRGPIWQLLAKSKDSQLEATYAELLKATSPHEKQIHRDLSRTFPKHEYFMDPDGPGQEALFNVVKAYSLYDTEVGYCQGLSFVVGPLLLNMPDEEAFCVLARMMSTYGMRGHYTPDMHQLQLRLFQYEQLMEECVPFVYRHFQVQGIKSTMYASQWFMTLFAYKFPLDLVFRVFDIVFVEGVEALLRFAIALLKANHDRLLGMEFEDLVEFLKNGLFEAYTNDASLFIQDAYNVKVTPKKLTQYAQKYQAMLVKQQQEQAMEESLREQNKQLMAQVKTLETSLSVLNKEHVDLAKEVISNKLEMARLQDDNDALQQKVNELTKIVDAQGKDVEERFRGEIESVLQKNMEYLQKNQQLEDQLNELENMLIETKMKYAESENERDALTRKLADLRKALGVH